MDACVMLRMLSLSKCCKLICIISLLFYYGSLFNFFFFFQAEDGIRDYKVTGVQTCALPILHGDLRLADLGLLRGLHPRLRHLICLLAGTYPCLRNACPECRVFRGIG